MGRFDGNSREGGEAGLVFPPFPPSRREGESGKPDAGKFPSPDNSTGNGRREKMERWLSLNDAMQDAGLGVPDSQIASDFAELEGEKARRSDCWVNWGFTLLIVAGAMAAIFWPRS